MRTVAHHTAIWLLVIATVVLAFQVGVKFRKWTWMMTDPIHFASDINRGFNWGYESATNGYVNLYEKMSSQQANWGNWLDYAPLRLAVMTFWGYQTRANYPGVTRWQADWEFNKPVLLFNTAMEAVAAICAFFIVRLWLRRASDDPKPFTGWLAGLLAALMLWFNPAILLSAHGWPTWDMWIIPMYLLAVLAASYNCWFLAGVAVAVGAMFKGQQLAVAAVFVIWPLVLLRFDAILKWAVGLVFGLGLLALPWLVTYVPPDAMEAMRKVQFDGRGRPWETSRLTLPDRIVDGSAVVWLVLIVVCTIGGPIVLRYLRKRLSSVQPLTVEPIADGEPPVLIDATPNRLVPITHRIYLSAIVITLLVVVAMIFWPWLGQQNRHDWRIGLGFTLLIAAIIPFIHRPRHILLLTAGALGAAALMTMVYFNGSSAWWICGWKYGTFHWPVMQMGVSSNLPGILQNRYDWRSPNQIIELWEVPPDWIWGYPKIGITFTIKQVLATVYAITLALSALGIGLQARRRDPRILIALTAPWLMFFCFPVQIHERYLLYAAGVGAITIGAGLGPALLILFLSCVTWLMTMHVMLNHAAGNGERGRRAFGDLMQDQFPRLFGPDAANQLHRFIRGTYPDIGWAVLLCAGIILYLSLAPSRSRSRLLADVAS